MVSIKPWTTSFAWTIDASSWVLKPHLQNEATKVDMTWGCCHSITPLLYLYKYGLLGAKGDTGLKHSLWNKLCDKAWFQRDIEDFYSLQAAYHEQLISNCWLYLYAAVLLRMVVPEGSTPQNKGCGQASTDLLYIGMVTHNGHWNPHHFITDIKTI